MATRSRVAIGGLAIAAVAGGFLLWHGSRGDAGRVWPVAWKVERQLDSKRVRLSMPIEYCIRKAPQFEEPIIEYEDDRASIEMRLVPEPEREAERLRSQPDRPPDDHPGANPR